MDGEDIDPPFVIARDDEEVEGEDEEDEEDDGREDFDYESDVEMASATDPESPNRRSPSEGPEDPFDTEAHYEELFGPQWQAEMEALQRTSASSACTVQWERGSIAFSCKQCQFDQTCVVCPECFFGADHEGHDTNLIRTVNGCCDCGDASSWNPKGFCTKHCGVSANEDSVESLDALPASLRTQASQVIPAVFDSLDPLVGNLASSGAIRPRLDWIQSVAFLSPGLRYLVTQALANGRLDMWVKACGKLPRESLKAMTGFFMALFQQSPKFKMAFSVACIQNYEETIKGASRTASISGLSVQLYSVPEVAMCLCSQHGAVQKMCLLLCTWLGKLCNLVKAGMEEAEETSIDVAMQASFNILGDLRYLFYDQGVCKYVLRDSKSRRAILDVLTVPWPRQRRKTGDHVLYEFDPRMVISRVESMAVECFRNLEEAGRNMDWEEALPWYDDLASAVEGTLKQVEMKVDGSGMSSEEFSLYWRVPRFFVNSLPLQSLQDAALEAASSQQQYTDELDKWRRLLTYRCVIALLRASVRSLVFAAEITNGSWVRNGNLLRVMCKSTYIDRGWQAEDLQCVQVGLIMAGLYSRGTFNRKEAAQLLWDAVSEGTLKDLVRDEDWVQEWMKIFRGQSPHPDIKIPPYDAARAEIFWEILGRACNEAWLLDITNGRVGAKGAHKPAVEAALARWFLHNLAEKSLTATDLENNLPGGWSQHPAMDKALQSVSTGRKTDNGSLKFELKAECWKQFDALHVPLGDSNMLQSSADTVDIAVKQGSDLLGPSRAATEPSCQAWRDLLVWSLTTEKFLGLLFASLRARLLLLGGGGPWLGHFAGIVAPTPNRAQPENSIAAAIPAAAAAAAAGLAEAIQQIQAATRSLRSSEPGKKDFLATSLCWMIKTLDLIHNAAPSVASSRGPLSAGISSLLDRPCSPPRGFGSLYRAGGDEGGGFIAELGQTKNGQTMYVGKDLQPVDSAGADALEMVSFWDPASPGGALGSWDEELVGLVGLIPESGALQQLCKGCCSRARQLRPKQSSASPATPESGKDSQAAKMEAKKRAMAARQKAMMAAMAAKQQKFAEDLDDMEVEEATEEKGEAAEKVLYCDVCRGAGSLERPVGLLSRSARSNALHRLGFEDGLSKEDIAVSSCGHILHSECFEKHRRHSNSRHADDILSLSRPGPGCIPCPMCRSVVSAWLPILPSAGSYWGEADAQASSTSSQPKFVIGKEQRVAIRDALDKLYPFPEEEKTPQRMVQEWMKSCKSQVMSTAALSPARIVPGGEAPPLHVAMLRIWSYLFSTPPNVAPDKEVDSKTVFLYSIGTGTGEPMAPSKVRDSAKMLMLQKAQALEAHYRDNTDKTNRILQGLLDCLVFVAWVVTSLFKFEDKDYNLLALLPTHIEQSIPALWHLIFGPDAEWNLSELLSNAVALTTPPPRLCRDLGGLVPFPELPKRYIDLIRYVYGKPCATCGKVPNDPCLCLACGAVICGKKTSRAQICKPPSDEDPPALRKLSGLCQRHAEVCGAGQGLFLSPYDTYIIAVSGTCNGVWETPYVDVYNEPIHATSTLNLTLDHQRWEKLRTIFTTATIAAEVVRNNRKSGRYVSVDL